MSQLYPLNKEHLQAFGGIVQQFARFERLVEIAISAYLNKSTYTLTAMTVSGLGYTAKCDALKSLIHISGSTKPDKDIFAAHIDDFNQYIGLRNAIAHQVWKEGAKQGTVKPMGVSARSGKGKIKGIKDDESEYTEDDLFRIHNDLVKLHDNFRGFLLACGFMAHMV